MRKIDRIFIHCFYNGGETEKKYVSFRKYITSFYDCRTYRFADYNWKHRELLCVFRMIFRIFVLESVHVPLH